MCLGYCLMGSHAHLLIKTPDGNLSKGMLQLNGLYTQKFNCKHGSVGHAFQARFKSIIAIAQAHAKVINHDRQLCK